MMDEIRRDKTGQVMIRVQSKPNGPMPLGQLAVHAHHRRQSTACYDGQFFFDTDHAEGDSGTQSNDITNDIVTTTAPTASELQTSILLATQTILASRTTPASR